MKIIKPTIVIALAILVFIACKKEYSFEGSLSVGTLKSDVTGDCLPSFVGGVYQADSTLNDTHFIDVEINATTPGSYNISSDTVNGYYFSKQGTAVFGTNTIRLLGKGKPFANGSNDFTIKYGTSTCVITVDVTGNVATGAIYTLESSPTGTCSGAIVNGTYKVGTALASTNTVSLQVNVLAPGTYRFGALSTNGMLFTASGVFTATGPQTVLLKGVGTPLAAGSFNISAGNLTSICIFSITVAPAASNTGVYTLNGAPGVCGGAVSAGTYAVGTALTVANTTQLQVTVTTVGSYNISTNSVNGFSFAGTGNFTTLGAQSVLLTATGTPTAAGTFNFTTTAGASTCTFSVVCTRTPPTTISDYRPETAFTNYSSQKTTVITPYPPSAQILDTAYQQVSPNIINKNGVNYYIMEEKDNGIAFDSILFRKNGAQYFELVREDLFGYFDNDFNTEVMFLDTTKGINVSWVKTLNSNTVNGITAITTVNSRITSKSPFTVGGIPYSDVIFTQSDFSVVIGSLPPQIFLTRSIWYAKGVGVVADIYQANAIPPPVSGNVRIKSFFVNRSQVF
jgi:hypothetical protein